MQIYLLLDGEKTGPFTIYDVTEEVRSGRADKDTLGWYRGSDGWERLEEMSALSSIFVPPAPRTEEIEVEELRERREQREQLAPERLRSSVRLWARLLDLILVYSVIFAVVFGAGLMTVPKMMSNSRLLFNYLLPGAVLMVLETFLLSVFGTTPGKWLLRVRVMRDDGGRIPLKISLYRALTVWWRGVGFWIMPFNILMMALSQARLLSTGKTAWDRECGLRLEYGKMDWNRVILIIGVLFAVYALMNFAFPSQLSELWEASKER